MFSVSENLLDVLKNVLLLLHFIYTLYMYFSFPHILKLFFNLLFYLFFILRYPDYEFISDNSISWSAGLHNRYTENSLRGVILDIHFLSQTDFLVCTFSSQVS